MLVSLHTETESDPTRTSPASRRTTAAATDRRHQRECMTDYQKTKSPVLNQLYVMLSLYYTYSGLHVSQNENSESVNINNCTITLGKVTQIWTILGLLVSTTWHCIPSPMKSAHIAPRSKKADLHPTNAKSYRPTSNLLVLSKLLERLVCEQLVTYLMDNGLLPDRQSAYRIYHSTETAVLRVLSNILSAVDSGNLAILTLLDLSATFDSVDYDTLLKRLQTSLDLGGSVISWFTSYLSCRTQCVHTKTTSSTPSRVHFEVPQGSILGPILFLLYTANMLQLVNRHHLHPHVYADDTHIYGSCNPADVDILRERVSVCVDDLSAWMRVNRLQLNPTKTEVLWCTGVHLDGVSIRSRPRQCVSAIRMYCRCHLYETSGSISTPTSPWPLTSLLPYDHVLRHFGRYAACGVLLTLLRALVVSKVIKFRLCVLTHRYLHGTAPPYTTTSTDLRHVFTSSSSVCRNADSGRPVNPSVHTWRWLPHASGTLCCPRCEQSSHWRRSGAAWKQNYSAPALPNFLTALSTCVFLV